MKSFLAENFLLESKTAEKLYFEHAEPMPIYDYHSHLSPKEIAEDKAFDNIGALWLSFDHYKWRVMRTAGVEERFISGDATDKEKYLAFAKTLPLCIGNPMYHWTHMELKRPFGINTLLGPDSAEDIWQETKSMLAQPAFSPRGILKQMNVKFVGTTDDPASSLRHHAAIRQEENTDFDVEISPSWRPDRAYKINEETFPKFIEDLSRVTDSDISTFSAFISGLEKQLSFFDGLGCKTADHGIERLYFEPVPSEDEASKIFDKGLKGETLSELEVGQFFSFMHLWFGEQYVRLNWVMQMHIGPLRNNNTRVLNTFGRDAGCDSMNDRAFAEPLAKLLDSLEQNASLPKTILYTLNPAANEMMATMAGNFQCGGTANKVQFGSGWWFNDQRDGMERHLEAIAQLSLLSQFVGMLTDSRSLLSFVRHEYFRRVLCNKVGAWVEKGEAPNDMNLLGGMIENICYNNAVNYFK